MNYLYTDGSCFPNPGPGGWGYKILPDITGYGGEMDTTNNRMEIQAVIEGLKRLGSGKVEIYSDSQYVVNIINSWLKNWVKNDWKKGKKKDELVKNSDILKDLHEQLQNFKYKAFWVRGHNGNEHNEDADQLAEKGRLELEQEEIERLSNDEFNEYE